MVPNYDSVIRIEDVSKHFGRFVALDSVTTSVSNGEIRAVIGPNGAGKTTLINVITRQLRATTGRIYFSGTDVTRFTPYGLARLGLARTFQISKLFPEMSVWDHIEVTIAAAEKYRGHDNDRTSLPEKVDSILVQIGLRQLAGRIASSISHGDQRVLEVGIALAMEPKALMLDEPTAGMSPAETLHFTEMLIKRLKGRYTIVLVEHDMNVIMDTADRITVLAGGKILAEGTPSEIKANAMVQEAYLGRPGSTESARVLRQGSHPTGGHS